MFYHCTVLPRKMVKIIYQSWHWISLSIRTTKHNLRTSKKFCLTCLWKCPKIPYFYTPVSYINVYSRAECKGAPPCPFLTPPLCHQNLCTCALLPFISIYVHDKNQVSVLFSINYVLSLSVHFNHCWYRINNCQIDDWLHCLSHLLKPASQL